MSQVCCKVGHFEVTLVGEERDDRDAVWDLEAKRVHIVVNQKRLVQRVTQNPQVLDEDSVLRLKAVLSVKPH